MTNLKCALLALLPLILIQAPPSFTLDIQLQEILIKGRALPPRRLARQVLFTFKPDRQVRSVGARFDHEGYRIFHPFARSATLQDEDLYVLLLDIPPDLDQLKLKYRLCVDGLWMSDPANPEYEEDPWGVRFSVFSADRLPEASIVNPEPLSGGRTRFRFRTLPGRIVTLAGTFNGWNPFSLRLEEIRPGFYETTVPLLAGRHYYLFFVNGDRTLDPYNLESATDIEGFRVSMFEIKRPN